MTGDHSFVFPDEPEAEVWNHLYAGISYAQFEFDRLGEQERKLVEALGAIISKSKTEFLLEPHDRRVLSLLEPFLDHPWIRHATEIELAEEGIGRLGSALERMSDLRPILSMHRIGPGGRRYLDEVINTYLYGFYGACIAMAGATFEQVLREIVSGQGIMSLEEMDEKKVGGRRLLDMVVQADVIKETETLAQRLLDERNRVMHRHIWDDRIAQQMAIGSVDCLGAVLAELNV